VTTGLVDLDEVGVEGVELLEGLGDFHGSCHELV
jgi:hypothetical protein